MLHIECNKEFEFFFEKANESSRFFSSIETLSVETVHLFESFFVYDSLDHATAMSMEYIILIDAGNHRYFNTLFYVLIQ